MKPSNKSHTVPICAECGSEYIARLSQTEDLCPECAHILYGYENCKHEFKDGRCISCYWNGNRSEYIKGLKKQ